MTALRVIAAWALVGMAIGLTGCGTTPPPRLRACDITLRPINPPSDVTVSVPAKAVSRP
jgi:hypothetical protein